MRTWTLTLTLTLAFALACAGEVPEATAPVAPAEAPVAAVPTGPAIAFYSDRALTQADLDGKTLRELSLMRNTIYARAGNPFKRKWLADYFAAQPWYRPAAQVDLTKLSDIDKANAALIGDTEANQSRTTLLDRRAKLRQKGALSPEETVEMTLIGQALGEYSGDESVPLAERNPLEDPTALDAVLNEGQMADLSGRDLRILRNTIFARQGRPFKSEDLQAYFAAKVWYAVDPKYTDERLSVVDRANIEKIKEAEAFRKEYEEMLASGEWGAA